VGLKIDPWALEVAERVYRLSLYEGDGPATPCSETP
jgi:hypothetical protein